MLTEEHAKEGLSRAYVQAVASQAGVIVSLKERSQDYGIDGSFHEVLIIKGRRRESGATLDFQLKATHRASLQDDFVVCNIDADTVNLLARRSSQPQLTQAILIICCLPVEKEQRLEISEREMSLRKCCYWCFISELTTNSHSATVRIPRSQVFSPEALTSLLKKVPERLLV